MFTKIAMILVLVTVALGGIGISMAAAQNDTPGNNVGVPAETQTQTMTQAQTQTMTMAKAMTMTECQQGNLARIPFSFKFGTQEEFVPGNPWIVDEIITGLGHMFGGYGLSPEVRGGNVTK